MRWIWIDRFTEFERGVRATAIKNVTLAEEHLHDHFPGYPVMPNALITEGMAQTGGLLVGEHINFEQMVVLAKVSKALFHCPAVPGDTLTYTAEVEAFKEDGAMIRGTSRIGDRLQGEFEIQFHFLGDARQVGLELDPKNFVGMLNVLGVFNFVASDGAAKAPEGLANLRAVGTSSTGDAPRT